MCQQKKHRLADQDGNLTNCLQSEQKGIKGHFGRLLGGEHLTLEQLIMKDRQDMVQDANKSRWVTKCISAVPTRVGLKRWYQMSDMNKALGEGGFGAEVRKLCPDEYVWYSHLFM